MSFRPGITGTATLKYRLEDEYLGNARALAANVNLAASVKVAANVDFDKMTDLEAAVWYNDNVFYPDKVRLNSYYYRHYFFWIDIKLIFAAVLGRKIEYAGRGDMRV